MRRAPSPAKKPVLLTGGNPQIAKAEGDAPVQEYIAAVSDWKRGICNRLDELITESVPGVHKAVRWNSPMYGIKGQGWFASFHVFTKYVKVTFFKGTSLTPNPPGGNSQEARWFDIIEPTFDESRLKEWAKQAASLPGWGKS